VLAGYDYLILRDSAKRFWTRTRIAGAALAITGGLLIGGGVGYLVFAANARADLDRYNVSTVELAPAWAVREAAPIVSSPSLIPDGETFYFGHYSHAPQATGPALPEGFALIDFSDENALYAAAAATGISVPALDIQASVVELGIEDLGDRRIYETPDNAAGHIPETPNAGENGGAWYFGHMESPLLGEGSVFRNLDQVPDMLIAGEEVQIIADNGSEQFLYQVTGTRVVHEDDMTLDSAGGPSMHLVACFPRLVYDHRLIVDATLIAKKSDS